MKLIKNGLFYFAIFIVLIAILTPEVEARRKILRGRKTITRTYYRSASIPAWAVVLLVGLGLVVAGGAAYGVLHRIVLKDRKDSYAPPMAEPYRN